MSEVVDKLVLEQASEIHEWLWAAMLAQNILNEQSSTVWLWTLKVYLCPDIEKRSGSRDIFTPGKPADKLNELQKL